MNRTFRPSQGFATLRDFVDTLEREGDLKRISRPVSLVHEVTEIHRRVLAADGPPELPRRPGLMRRFFGWMAQPV